MENTDYSSFKLLGPETVREILAAVDVIRQTPIFRNFTAWDAEWRRVNGEPDDEARGAES